MLVYSNRLSVLDLTFYEVGNTLWKEHRKGRIKRLEPVVSLFDEVLRMFTVFSPSHELGEILNLAIKENLTFYDASYLYVAREHGLKLVTEDEDLLRYGVSINVDQLLGELK